MKVFRFKWKWLSSVSRKNLCESKSSKWLALDQYISHNLNLKPTAVHHVQCFFIFRTRPTMFTLQNNESKTRVLTWYIIPRERIFHLNSRHWEVTWKTRQYPRFFHQLRGIWKSDRTLLLVHDKLSQKNLSGIGAWSLLARKLCHVIAPHHATEHDSQTGSESCPQKRESKTNTCEMLID